MIDIRRLLTVPKTGIVDVVAWAMTILGSFGLVIAGLQLPMLILMRVPKTFWGLWFVAVVQFAIVAYIGLGLRRRRNSARAALVWVLLFGVLWNTYWLVGAILGRSLPLIPETMVQDAPFRVATVGFSVFWSAVYVWLVLKFTNRDVIREFAQHDA